MAKTYTVVKDGIEQKELKTLPAAKKLADAEGAEVVCEGEVVYTPELTAPDTETPNDTTVEDEVEKPVEETPTLYALTTRMNVRKDPSTSATKLRVAEKGAVVEVASIQNDWLCLTDGSYILYGGGKYATKN